MAVLREITARLGLQLDRRSFAQAEQRVEGLTGALDRLGGLAFAIGTGVAFNQLIGLASDAQETLNKLDVTFQDSAESVKQWATDFSASAGRSEFAMREVAADLGSILNPLLDENAELAAKMAIGLSQAVVDIESFTNAEQLGIDTAVAVRSAIVGETESIKRLGIVMLDASLEAFRLEKGITTAFKSMSIAEKTALRYEFILQESKLAQGDAARTSEMWALSGPSLGATS